MPNPNHRPWTPEEDAELKALAKQSLQHGILRGSRTRSASRIIKFAKKHGRTVAAVKMRAKRIAARSYLVK